MALAGRVTMRAFPVIVVLPVILPPILDYWIIRIDGSLLISYE